MAGRIIGAENTLSQVDVQAIGFGTVGAAVQEVDASHPLPTSSPASATGPYVEDAAAAADPTGPMLMLVRRDTLTSSEVSVDGDNIAGKANSRGQMHVDASGGIASGAADAGNGVKITVVFNTTPPTVTTGQRVDLQGTARGELLVTPSFGAVPGTALADNADAVAVSATVNKQAVVARGSLFNGTTWDRLYGNTAGQYVQGNVASGAADSGNPSKVGGVFNTTQPTVTNGQRVDFQSTNRGEQLVTLSWGAVPGVALADNADGVAVSATVNGMKIASRGYVFNGTSWDRQRGDTNGAYVVNIPIYKVGKARARIVSAATNNAANNGAQARQVFNVSISNKHATNWAVFKIYNQSSSPNPATDSANIAFHLACGPGKTENWTNPDIGFALGTGLAWTIVQDFTDAGNTAVTAGDVLVQIEYI